MLQTHKIDSLFNGLRLCLLKAQGNLLYTSKEDVYKMEKRGIGASLIACNRNTKLSLSSCILEYNGGGQILDTNMCLNPVHDKLDCPSFFRLLLSILLYNNTNPLFLIFEKNRQNHNCEIWPKNPPALCQPDLCICFFYTFEILFICKRAALYLISGVYNMSLT